MLFNSLIYAAFLPAVLALYFCLSHRWQNWMLLAASYLFYGWWDDRFLFLVICSSTLDFIVGLLIERGSLTKSERLVPSMHLVLAAFLFCVLDWGAIGFASAPPFVSVDFDRLFVEGNLGWPVFFGTIIFVLCANILLPFAARLREDRRRRIGITISIVGQLGLLGFFKYFDFFVESAEVLLRSFGFEPAPFRLNLILPVGISFYTFQTLSYTIDIYRREIRATSRYTDFALFVAYFPQLVAGPIERARNLIPHLQSQRRISLDDISGGAYLILLGLFKKVAIADGIGPTVASVFNSMGTPTWAEVVCTSTLFLVQLYCDFSGYSDIARGSSRLMGIPLMLNFRIPLLAATPAEFWQRWHLSLTTWLRDYVYYSLGANRRKDFKMYRNLFLTMAIGGLWHGAAWTFVVWGAIEGVALVLNHMFLGKKFAPPRGAPGFAYFFKRLPLILLFFYIHLVSPILFRSGTWERAMVMLGAFFGDIGNLNYNALTPTMSALVGIVLLMLIEICEYAKDELEIVRKAPIPVKAVVYASMILLITMGTANDTKQFIYFQF